MVRKCLTHPVSVPSWRLLDSPKKMSNFQKFSGLKPRNKFFTGEIRKATGKEAEPTGNDMKIQQGKLANILR